MTWFDGIHHDGSIRYVSNPLPHLNETVTITLRTPKDAPIKAIALRTTPDGEGHREMMTITVSDTLSDYWQAELTVSMPTNPYRFEVLTTSGKLHYNSLGASAAKMSDLYDFKLLADFKAPSWLPDAVFYQIFPDRFHNGDPAITSKDGAWSLMGYSVQQMPWDADPLAWREGGNLDFFGGDLIGIQAKLDYLKALGVNAIYLTPIFKSLSNHRYNIDDFFNVDEHLGGNPALANLVDAMHAHDMKLILDVTPNHSSNTSEWFKAAQADANAPSAAYYTFNTHPDDYVSWLGVPILPKLNYGSDGMKDVMYRDENAVLRHWLKPPYNVDGWRLDVYNMTARQGELQLSKEVGRGMRQAVKETNPDAYLFGEHFFDGTAHLQGDEMDATMNYTGFNIPMWQWLCGYDGLDWKPEIEDTTLFDTQAFDQQLNNFRAPVPWVVARQQFHQLGNHDTRRILSITGDKALVKLGTAMLMAYPGVPCIYYGDEIALAGERDPNNRRPMPWDESQWDDDMLTFHKYIIQLRRTQHALMHGGYQTLYAQGDLWVFLRESDKQKLVVVGYRGPDTLEEITIPVWHGGIADGTLTDLLTDNTVFTVQDGHLTLHNLQKGTAFMLQASE